MTSRTAYRSSVKRIKQHIADGDTYQVNYTFMLETGDPVDPSSLFFSLYHAQPSPYATLIETSDFQIMSASPELFFQLDGDRIVCEPMKGTCPRSMHPSLDAVIGGELQRSTKNRAENVMIVDMVRNDLSRIAEPGSVSVEELFKVTQWPTLWQMTSKVTATTKADLPGIFCALFPSASITGAPKLKTSEIIAELEQSPRGVYTGAIGWWAPGRHARFSVAIRTATRISKTAHTSYGIGSGIVWDSREDDEYRECLLKSRILHRERPTFRLLETIRWDRSRGYVMLEQHLKRMLTSARYFDFTCDPEEIRSKLNQLSKQFETPHRRVRLLVSRKGVISIDHQELTTPGHYDKPLKAPEITCCMDMRRLDIHSPLLYHKTSRRAVYEQARRRFPRVDEVILVNNRGELMEFTAGNLVVKRGNEWLTPSLESGLLPGVFRDHLVEKKEIKPARLLATELDPRDDIFFINSVRGWRRVHLKTPGDTN